MPDQNLLEVAYAKARRTVITGGRLVNVRTGEIYPADVATAGTRIIAAADIGRAAGPERG
jgi:adenine deaminase